MVKMRAAVLVDPGRTVLDEKPVPEGGPSMRSSASPQPSHVPASFAAAESFLGAIRAISESRPGPLAAGLGDH